MEAITHIKGERSPGQSRPPVEPGESGRDNNNGIGRGTATVGPVATGAYKEGGGERAVHGYGISYAGELPHIAVRQAVELTEFHNRPA